MELKKENSNKINILDEVIKKPIFESLTEGWDQDYKNDEVPPYLKEIPYFCPFLCLLCHES